MTIGMSLVSDRHIEEFRENGAVCVRGLVSGDWRQRMAAAFEANLNDPGPLAQEYADTGKSTRFHGDQFLWMRHDALRDYVLHGPIVEAARAIMRTEKLNLFFDHLLIKEPGAIEPTPWHQDLPYWQLKGSQVCSIWVGLDPVTAESGGVQYVRGSHKWGKTFKPLSFTRDPDTYMTDDLQTMPQDIDEICNQEDLIGWDLQPGDAVIHHALTIHGAAGNRSRDTRRRGYAVRYTGDDVVWDPRSYCAPIIADPGLVPADPLDCALFPLLARDPVQ